jgi:hypothetical protein
MSKRVLEIIAVAKTFEFLGMKNMYLRKMTRWVQMAPPRRVRCLFSCARDATLLEGKSSKTQIKHRHVGTDTLLIQSCLIINIIYFNYYCNIKTIHLFLLSTLILVKLPRYKIQCNATLRYSS